MTGTIRLLFGAGVPADGSSGNSFPALSVHTSDDSDTPQFRQFRAAFDDTADELYMWAFRLPASYASGGDLKGVYHMASATSGKVVLRACVQTFTPGDSVDMEALDPVNDGEGWAETNPTVPGTAGYTQAFSITIDLPSDIAAGDWVALIFGREGSDGTDDTATGDCIVAGELQLEYTTT